jgi:hypothetical protein
MYYLSCAQAATRWGGLDHAIIPVTATIYLTPHSRAAESHPYNHLRRFDLNLNIQYGLLFLKRVPVPANF